MVIDIRLYLRGNNIPKIKSLNIKDNIIEPKEVRYYNHDDNSYSIQIIVSGIDQTSINFNSIVFDNPNDISIDKITILPSGDEDFDIINLKNI